MTITVSVSTPTVVPAVTNGATVSVDVSGGVSGGTIGSALRVSVANIDDPSTEMAALPDASLPAGTIRIASQDVAGANAYRIYILDLASATAQSTPNRIDRSAGGQWVQIGGKGLAGGFTVETTLAVGTNATVGGTLGVTGATTLSSTLAAGASTLASLAVTAGATVGTTLGVTGVGTFSSGTSSTSTSTGAIVVSGSGGIGVSGAAWIGGLINVAGAATMQSTLDVTGAVVLSSTLAVESVASAAAIVTVGSLNALAGATQVGMYANLTGTSAGTTSVRGFQADVRSAAAAYTMTNAIGFLAGSGSIGAGSTVTRFSGFHASNGHGATNKACLSYSTSATLPTFSGSYFFYNEVAAPSYTAGAVTIADTTDATALGTAALVCSGGVSVALRLILDGATGKTLRIVNSVANAAVATTLGSVGPTGSTAGNPQGWMRIDINGTDRYMPFW